MKHSRSLRILPAAAAALLASCTSVPLPPDTSPVPGTVAPTPATPSGAPVAVAPSTQPSPPSGATTPRAYRADAATHIYGRNADRIWKGRLPPMLYAIGVLDVEVDRRGNVSSIQWRRAPRHAPEVVAEIERTVRSAAPFPVPARLGKVVYTDTWLWHESGRFQLDTLTEGQD